MIIPSSVQDPNRSDPEGMPNLHKYLCRGAGISTPIISLVHEIEDEQGDGYGQHHLDEPIVGVLN